LCRESWESALSIRREQLKEEDEDLLCTVNNFANLENGEGHPGKTLKLYAEVQAFREKMSPETQVSLAFTYMGTGQALVQIQKFVEAEEFYDRANKIIVETYGPEGHYVSQSVLPSL
jgi:hypothetical protein